MNLFLTGGSVSWGRLFSRSSRARRSPRARAQPAASIRFGRARVDRRRSRRPGHLSRGREALPSDGLLHLAWQGLPDYGAECGLRVNAELSIRLFNVAADEACGTLMGIGSC